MSRRAERVANLIRNTVGRLLLSKLSDPRVDPARTSITRVVVPADLLTAKIYVSVMGTENQQKLTIRALQHAAGHLQELLMREISLRETPRLEFILDSSFKNTLETYRLIQQAMDEIEQKERDNPSTVETSQSAEKPEP